MYSVRIHTTINVINIIQNNENIILKKLIIKNFNTNLSTYIKNFFFISSDVVILF